MTREPAIVVRPEPTAAELAAIRRALAALGLLEPAAPSGPPQPGRPGATGP